MRQTVNYIRYCLNFSVQPSNLIAIINNQELEKAMIDRLLISKEEVIIKDVLYSMLGPYLVGLTRL